MLMGIALFLYLHSTKVVRLANGLPNLSHKLPVDASKVLEGFNQVCRELRLSTMAPVELPMNVEFDENKYDIEPGPTIKLNNDAYEFTFLQADGSLMQYIDIRLFDALYESYAPYYDKPDKPKWTQDQAIQVGNSFLKSLSQQIKIKLGNAGARFDQERQNSKYHVGQWMIWWPRVDSKGNVFSEDGVTMEIAEGHGPVSLQIKQTTLYSEEKGSPMKMQEALDKIHSKIASNRFWDKIKSVNPWHQSGGWTDTKPTGSYLQIVCPGHQKNLPARLAWVFWFQQHPWEMMENPPNPPVHFHYPISFWIDAYTGECIGGDVVGMDTPD